MWIILLQSLERGNDSCVGFIIASYLNTASNIKLTIKRLFEIISFNRLIYFYSKQFIEAVWAKTKTPKRKRMMRAAGWF